MGERFSALCGVSEAEDLVKRRTCSVQELYGPKSLQLKVWLNIDSTLFGQCSHYVGSRIGIVHGRYSRASFPSKQVYRLPKEPSNRCKSQYAHRGFEREFIIIAGRNNGKSKLPIQFTGNCQSATPLAGAKPHQARRGRGVGVPSLPISREN